MKLENDKSQRTNILALRNKIEKTARKIGFDVVGFSPAKIEEKYQAAYREWINAGNFGNMNYLNTKERFDRISNMQSVVPNAKSVIVVALNYYRPQEPLKRGHGRIARYAYGRDYHKIMGAKLKKLRVAIDVLSQQYYPNEKHENRSFVDVGPLLERALAEQAGVGVTGKNSLIITKNFGSWVVLGEIVTTLPLTINDTEYQQQKSKNKSPFSSCGSCTRCIQSCPTGAIIAPGIVDARKCISYLTIEHEGPLPSKLKKIIKKTKKLFGCDICQEVCPHNSRQKISIHNEFTIPPLARDSLHAPTLKKIKTDSLFFKKYAGSGLMRPGKTGMRRNAAAI